MVGAASPDPSLSPDLPAPESDKADRGMAAAASRGAAQCREKDHPPREAPSAKKVATSPNDNGSPRTDSRNHVEGATSLGTIIIDGPDVKDTAQTADTKPGILANEKIASESKGAAKCKNALTSDAPSKKGDREKKPTKAHGGFERMQFRK